jgi:hypothetical protein
LFVALPTETVPARSPIENVPRTTVFEAVAVAPGPTTVDLVTARVSEPIASAASRPAVLSAMELPPIEILPKPIAEAPAVLPAASLADRYLSEAEPEELASAASASPTLL